MIEKIWLHDWILSFRISLIVSLQFARAAFHLLDRVFARRTARGEYILGFDVEWVPSTQSLLKPTSGWVGVEGDVCLLQLATEDFAVLLDLESLLRRSLNDDEMFNRSTSLLNWFLGLTLLNECILKVSFESRISILKFWSLDLRFCFLIWRKKVIEYVRRPFHTIFMDDSMIVLLLLWTLDWIWGHSRYLCPSAFIS